jgi:hypothetical protein
MFLGEYFVFPVRWGLLRFAMSMQSETFIFHHYDQCSEPITRVETIGQLT